MPDFKPITLQDKDIIAPILYMYGKNSCQNSFVSSYLHRSKYDDYYCIFKDFLLIFRKGLSQKDKYVFLFPVGDYEKVDILKECIDALIAMCNDANKSLVFSGITAKVKEFLDLYYKDSFEIEDNRDYYEYLFSVDNFSNLPGKNFENRRWQVRKFYKEYEGKIEIRHICLEDVPEIKNFHTKWLDTKYADKSLDYETKALYEALESFEELGLFGIIVKIDGEVCGINIGAKLSDDAVDGIFIKGDINIRFIYTILFHKFAELCCQDYSYINGEEDLGIEGLRNVKLSYYPTALIEKYNATYIN